MKELSNRYSKEDFDEVLECAKYAVEGKCGNSILLSRHAYKKLLKRCKELMEEYDFAMTYEEIRRELLRFYRRQCYANA